MWSTIDKRSLPLDHPKFNAFQHGGKVVAQDMATLQACLTAGQAEGKPMKALVELLARLTRARPGDVAPVR